MGFHCVSQAGLELLESSDPPALASQGAGITGMNHRALLRVCISNRLSGDSDAETMVSSCLFSKQEFQTEEQLAFQMQWHLGYFSIWEWDQEDFFAFFFNILFFINK